MTHEVDAAWRTNDRAMDFRACNACGAVGRLQTGTDNEGREIHVDYDEDGIRIVCGAIRRYRVRKPLGASPRIWRAADADDWQGDR